MRANIEERLSDAPRETKTIKNQKTTWLDIAIGIYVGGMMLAITGGAISLFFTWAILNGLRVQLNK